jgi:hypothetical protein
VDLPAIVVDGIDLMVVDAAPEASEAMEDEAAAPEATAIAYLPLPYHMIGFLLLFFFANV